MALNGDRADSVAVRTPPVATLAQKSGHARTTVRQRTCFDFDRTAGTMDRRYPSGCRQRKYRAEMHLAALRLLHRSLEPRSREIKGRAALTYAEASEQNWVISTTRAIREVWGLAHFADQELLYGSNSPITYDNTP